MGASNIVTGAINVMTILLSIALIGAGIWLGTKVSTECVSFLRWPIIGIGIGMLLISAIGCAGAFCRQIYLLYIYLFLVFILLLLLLAFIIFAFVVVKDGPSSSSQTGRITYNIHDYSPWLQDRVQESRSWSKIKSCIQQSKICAKLYRGIQSLADVNRAVLSSIESGCCMPPAVCGYSIATANSSTAWIKPTNISASPDCSAWSNDQETLCYDCESCRGGVLASVKQQWQKIGIVSFVVWTALLITYAVAYCAFQSSLKEHLRRLHMEPWRSRAWRERNWFNDSS